MIILICVCAIVMLAMLVDIFQLRAELTKSRLREETQVGRENK